MGIAGEMKFAALSNGLQIEFAGEFVIEREIADVDVGIDGGRIGSAGAFENEVGASFDGETIGMNLPDVGEIEIVAGEVEAKGAGWKDCRRRFR